MILNSWYAVLPSKAVKKDKLTAVKRFGMDLVLFRTEENTVVCLMDLCAHRGAALSKGKCVDNNVMCPFHGIRYDKHGAATVIPSEGKCNKDQLARFNVSSFSALEENDVIYIWYGDRDPDKPLDTFSEITDDFAYTEISNHWKVHYSRLIENQLDVSHLPFVHHNTIGRGNKTLVNGPKIIFEDENTMVHSADNEVDECQEKKPPEKARIKDTKIKFKWPNQWLNCISEKLMIYAYFVPVDDDNAIIYIRFYNRFTGLKPVDKFISLFGAIGNYIVQRQDKGVVQTQRPKKTGLMMNENLLRADGPIIEYRKRRHKLQNENKKD